MDAGGTIALPLSTMDEDTCIAVAQGGHLVGGVELGAGQHYGPWDANTRPAAAQGASGRC